MGIQATLWPASPLTWCCGGRSPRWPRSRWRCWPYSTPQRPPRRSHCPWSAPGIRPLVVSDPGIGITHLLRGHSKCDCPQVNFLVRLDAGKNKKYSWKINFYYISIVSSKSFTWTLGTPRQQASKSEYDSSLVFLNNLSNVVTWLYLLHLILFFWILWGCKNIILWSPAAEVTLYVVSHSLTPHTLTHNLIIQWLLPPHWDISCS